MPKARLLEDTLIHRIVLLVCDRQQRPAAAVLLRLHHDTSGSIHAGLLSFAYDVATNFFPLP